VILALVVLSAPSLRTKTTPRVYLVKPYAKSGET
jgi:hypothetical protein